MSIFAADFTRVRVVHVRNIQMRESLENILLDHGVRPTAIRLLVLEALGTDDRAYSLSELEAKLGSVDKSSIFRTLTLFLEHCIVHCVEDSQGQTHYAPCAEGCHCHDVHGGMPYLHAHFECERCGCVWCLRDMPLPEINAARDFHVHTASYVLRGLCAECRRKVVCPGEEHHCHH